jgi:DNA repair protein RecN (Recombination protein N)
MSRLALALETSYLELKHRSYGNDIDVVGTINEQSTSSRDNTSAMMIFDELDAHIGGEAAVAVAKLLKLQGRFRQIIAVTHSPIIAASADKHFLVWRSISDSTSQVMELTETQREREIARMSTGNTEDLQGLILARKMLNNRLNVS